MQLLAIFRPQGFGSRLSDAAHDYLKDYVFSPEEFVSDHKLTAFERVMFEDFLGGLFSDDQFGTLLQAAAAGMKATGLDPEGPDFPVVP